MGRLNLHGLSADASAAGGVTLASSASQARCLGVQLLASAGAAVACEYRIQESRDNGAAWANLAVINLPASAFAAIDLKYESAPAAAGETKIIRLQAEAAGAGQVSGTLTHDEDDIVDQVSLS